MTKLGGHALPKAGRYRLPELASSRDNGAAGFRTDRGSGTATCAQRRLPRSHAGSTPRQTPTRQSLSPERASSSFGSQLFYKKEKQVSLNVSHFSGRLPYQSVGNRTQKPNPSMAERETRSSRSVSTWVSELPSHFLHHLLP